MDPIFLITGGLSLLFTLLILSYVVGDNPGFRMAIHAFIGISAGYVAAVVLTQVIANKIMLPLASGLLGSGATPESVTAGIALVLGVVLLAKISQRTEWIARPIVAFLVGTGAAAAVAGAMLGTLYPQALASVNSFKPDQAVLDLISAGVILLGTVATLAYFQFTVFGKSAPGGRRGWLMTFIAFLGQAFIAITLGALFAGAFSAGLTALVDRVQSIVSFFDQIIRQSLH